MHYKYVVFLFAILLFNTDQLAAWSPGLYQLFESDGKQGLKDDSGKILIPAIYETLGWSEGDEIVVKGVIGFKKNDLWGLLTIDNEVLTRPVYKRLYPTGQNLLIASKPNSSFARDFLGLISPKGQEILPFKYAFIEVTNLRVIVARKTNDRYTYGLLELNGDVLIPLNYKEINVLGGLRFAVKNFDGQTAIYDDEGRQLIGFELDSISRFSGKYAVIYKGGRRGAISKEGEIVVEPEYQEVVIAGNEISVRPVNEWVLLKGDNSRVARYNAAKLDFFSETLFVATTNGVAQLTDMSGEMITTTKFQQIGPLEGTLAACKVKGRWGVMNKKGVIKIPPKFDTLLIDGELILGKQKGYWSLYDSFNIKKSNTTYQEIGGRTGRLFPVKKNKYWGFINRSGEEVIHCVYDHVGDFVESLAPVSFHKETGIIDKEGEWVVLPAKVDSLTVLNQFYYLSYTGRLKKLMHVSGDLIYFTENPVEPKAGYLLEHISDGGIWKIDFSGRIVEEARDDRYEEVRAPSEGLYAIKKDGSYGFIDAQNRLLIANRYEDVGDFHEGMASFRLLNKWGFMNKKEEIVIQPVYTRVSSFKKGVAIAYDKTGAGLIDIMGNRLSSFQFDTITVQENGHFLIRKEGKLGVMNATGQVTINPKYDYIEDSQINYTIVGKSGKYGLVDGNGVNTIPMIYDTLLYDPYRKAYLALKKSTLQKVQLQ